MIRPHKYLNLDVSVINISGLIIEVLRENEIVPYSELLQIIVSKKGKSVVDNYPYAINFLFLLGKIEYYKSPLDAFSLVKQHHEVK